MTVTRPDLWERNLLICVLHEGGMVLQDIADLYGLSRTRVWQITITTPMEQIERKRRAKVSQVSQMFEGMLATLAVIEQAAIKAGANAQH